MKTTKITIKAFVILLILMYKTSAQEIVNSEPNNSKELGQSRGIIMKLWDLITSIFGNGDSFVGRCFGLARQVRFAMPIVLVKLGVIVTVLAFLTIFSLKSMALLVFLVLISTSQIAGKFALWKASAFGGIESEHHHHPPQNVHFHVHPKRNGNYAVEHSAGPWIETKPWDRTLDSPLDSNNIIDNISNERLKQFLETYQNSHKYSDRR